MSERPFVDYYEVLQLSPNASGDTIERVYRILAKRYHPDNVDTGDAQMFAQLREAFDVLSSTESRAKYDVRHEQNRSMTWKVFAQDTAGDGRENDRRLLHGILSVLYIARRRDPLNGGLGTVTLEKILGCPAQHLEFPLWYLKERGWMQRLDNGMLAITADGVDKLDSDPMLPANRLLTSATSTVDDARSANAIKELSSAEN
jgi:curved DNA-binding protein CbpA